MTFRHGKAPGPRIAIRGLSSTTLALLLAPPGALAVESIHFGYSDPDPAMTDSLRLPTRDGTFWWSANKQRYNAEDNSPVAYSYHDGYVENSFFLGTTHTASEAAARWRSIMTGNGDPWTGATAAQIGTPQIIILDELVSSFTDGGDGTLLRNALQLYLQYPGATRNDIAAFLSPGFCQSTSIQLSNYDDLVYSANNYLRSIQLELYATEPNFNSGGDTYLASQLGAPLRKWTTSFGVAASRVQPTLLVSNFASTGGSSYPLFLNKQFQFMANGWYTAAHAVDNNVRTAMRTGVSSYTWTPGINDYQLVSTETLRDAYFEEFLNWYSVLGQTQLDNFWNADASGNWSAASNWLTGAVPGGVDAWGKFLFPVSQARTVTIATSVTLGHLIFDDSSSYTLDGAGGINMQVSSGAAEITVNSGGHAINNPITLTSSTVFTINPAAATLTTAGQITAANITKTGAGRLRVKNARTGTLSIVGGTLEILPDGTAAGVSTLSALSLSAGGRLDLGDNKLILFSGANSIGTFNGSTYTGTTGLIQAGRNGSSLPLWDGSNAIVTSQSTATSGNLHSIGIATANQAGRSVFAGVTVTPDDLLVMFTYGGDANLDGKINIDDYVRIDNGIAGGLTGWFNGDFNYDGKVNIDDYTTIIDANIASQTGVFLTSAGVQPIPEPATTVLLSVPLLFVSRRRRRI